ncbi:MAG: hypothetical protein Fur0012_10170 [Elusimicrobiota bacterium]
MNKIEKLIAELCPKVACLPRRGEFCVYVLKCADGSFYIGQTDNFEKRMNEHKTGYGAKWVKSHLPFEIIHFEIFTTRENAVKREQDLKTGFGRKWLKREYAKGRLNAPRRRQVEFKKVGDVCEIYTGVQFNRRDMQEVGDYPVINGGVEASGYSDKYNENENTITISQGGASAGWVSFIKTKFWAGAHCYVVKPNNNEIDNKYLYFFLKQQQTKIMEAKHGAGIPGLNRERIKAILIPIPPLQVQREIVNILDKFTELEAELEAELEGRKKQYEYYRDSLLSFEGKNIEFKKLDDVVSYERPDKYIVRSTEYDDNFKTPVLTAGQSFILGYTNEIEGIYKANKKKPVIIFDDFTTSIHWVDFDFKVKSSAMKLLTAKDENTAILRYLYYAMKCIKYNPSDHARQWIAKYSQFKIPIPPMDEQKRIVNILDRFDKLVNDISEGLPAEIAARKKQYEYYRNKLLSFKEL